MKRAIALLIAGCALGVAGYQVTAADAHTAQIVISCDSVGFNYADFPDAANTADYSVAVSSGSGSRSGVFSWTGTSFSNAGAIHAAGTSTVTASTSWTADGGGQASRTETLECEAPPTTTTTTTTPPPTVCADGLPPDAGHDGQPGNDACDHTTTVPPPTTTSATPPPSPTTTEATTGTTTTQVSTPAPTPTKPKPVKDAGGVLGVTGSTVQKQVAVRGQLAFTP
jgi:hypothetical protein